MLLTQREIEFSNIYLEQSHLYLTNNCVMCKGEEGNDYPVFSYLEIVGQTRDPENKSWGRLLKLKDLDNQFKFIYISMEMLAGEGTELYKLLLNAGMIFYTKNKYLLIAYIQQSTNNNRIRCVTSLGWHFFSYVLPTTVLKAKDCEEEIILQSSRNTGFEKFKENCSLGEWKENVGKYFAGNSKLILAGGVTLTGPLLHLLNEENGGLHFVGDSSSGKTTVSKIVGSICGGGTDRGFIESWRATDNALEATAHLHNHSTLILDEISEVDPKKISHIVYMLANGVSKQRLSKDATPKPTFMWKLTFISTGERAISTLLRQNSLMVQAGIENRVISINADAKKGLGIFENIHDQKSPAEFARLLTENSIKYFGSPIRSFISKIIENKEEALTFIKEHQLKFNEEVRLHYSSGQIQRVGYKFALYAAAAELAIRFGILPLKVGDAYNSITSCFEDWVSERSDENLENDQCIGYIKALLQEYGISYFPELKKIRASMTFTDLNDDDTNVEMQGVYNSHQWGFRREVAGDMQWMIWKNVFTKEFCNGFDQKRVLSSLVEKGYLIKDCEGNTSVPIYIPHVGKKIRFYVISRKIFEDDEPKFKNMFSFPDTNNNDDIIF